MTGNPFKYGELSSGLDFCNRKLEIKRIHQAFYDAQNIILISPRRWGKTSLIEEAARSYKQKHVIARIDCFGLRSGQEFYMELLKEVIRASESRLQEVAHTVKKFLAALVPYISYSMGANEELKLSFSMPTQSIDTSAILDLAQKIAVDKNQKFIVCIDEFQKISEWEGGKALLEKLRSHWQRHKQVSYCLYGSKRHLMTTLFANSSQPFYRFGETIFLTKIGRDEWINYIFNQFAKTGVKVTPEMAGKIADQVQCHSYYVQYLCRLCWNNTMNKLTEEIIDQSFRELLNDHLELFRKLTDRLTHYQVNYLKALCAGEKQLTSQRVLQTYNLGSHGNIKRIEKVMEDSEIIDYFGEVPVFCDPYFDPLFRKYFM